MTATAISMSTQLPCGPDRLEISPREITVTGRYESGGSHGVNVVHNHDLNVILPVGQKTTGMHHSISTSVEEGGHVVIALDVDGEGDYSQVHYAHRNDLGAQEILTQAIETLIMARDAVQRVSALALQRRTTPGDVGPPGVVLVCTSPRPRVH